MNDTPSFATGSVLATLYAMPRPDAIRLLETNYEVFCKAVEEVYAGYSSAPIEPQDDGAAARVIALMAQQLRDTGFTAYRGYFPDQAALAAARELSRWVRERSDQLGVSDENVLDEQNDVLLWKRQLPGASRASFRVSALPPALQPFCGDGVLERIMQLAIGNERYRIEPAVMVVDNMLPITEHEFQWWHFDRLRDQFKVMILLDDVTPETGPMKIVPRTHRFHPERRIMDFGIYAAGLDYGDVSYSVYSRLKAQTLQLTGKAGDIFIFDTRAFHAHGRCAVGERMTATLYYNGLDTPLNRFCSDFQPGRTI